MLGVEFDSKFIGWVRGGAGTHVASVAMKDTNGYGIWGASASMTVSENSVSFSDTGYLLAKSDGLGKPFTLVSGDVASVTRVWGVK